MKEKMIEYSKSDRWKEFSGNSPYENKQIEKFINYFFDQYQPERSKREDAIKECEEMGHVNTWMPKNQTLCMRCGALNPMET